MFVRLKADDVVEGSEGIGPGTLTSGEVVPELKGVEVESVPWEHDFAF